MPMTSDVAHEGRALFFSSGGSASRNVVSLLEQRGIRVTERGPEEGAGRFAIKMRPRLILIEQTDGHAESWQKLALELARTTDRTPMILLAKHACEELAIAALRLGIRDYLKLPVSSAALSEALDRCLGLKSGSGCSGEPMTAPQVDGDEAGDAIVGSSEALCSIRKYMLRAATSDCAVLITGETGTGKELAAEFIHKHSPRRNKPFLCLNCAAIPDPLLESELFGHVRGAFTGADSLRDGLLASAEGGTVLLDEIGDMSLSAQAKILRVLEKKEVSRLGGTQQRKVDVRFVAATNQDLERMASRGTFRRDLYYRLNVARVELPPLRERKDDIPLLVEYYRHRLGGAELAEISAECLHHISQYDWPGNIRELRNVLESILLHGGPGEIRADALPREIREKAGGEQRLPANERERLVQALCETHWNRSRAAEKLQWSRMTLYRKMAKYRISQLLPLRMADNLEV